MKRELRILGPWVLPVALAAVLLADLLGGLP